MAKKSTKQVENSNDIKDVVDPGIVEERIGTITGRKGLNLTEIKAKALKLWKENPTMKTSEIGKKLVELGLAKNERYIYDLLKKDESLHGEIERIRRLNAEMLSKDIVPLALKETKEALEDKKYSRDRKFKFVKLSLDKEFGQDESRRSSYPGGVNIETLQIIQQNQLTTCEDRLKKMGEEIESPRNVTPEDDQQDA